ncbi:MAG: NAD(P)H-dependent glycerol-3-phosphate dehydrogenase [Flavobacteriaceae bacterium]|nr:NAD(P)H-dependent glycerol-3-phosphate dehydrogenase [Flavobacteriaceae bacterium]MDG1966240.1 NAD(P)H-dependent glycerol-3-phosphate dehydrogenase [Flavobacteriaceae bacterium]
MRRPPKKPTISHLILKNKLKIAVLGGGSWATALVKILSENKRKVGWYIRNPINADFVKKHHHNPNYLSAARLKTKRLEISSDLNQVVSQADVLVIAIPSAFLSQELEKLTESFDDKIIFSAVKGVVPESMLIVGEHFNTKFNVPMEKIGVILGPSHAEEIAMERLSYLTVACMNKKLAKAIAAMLKTQYIRTTISNDIVGTEYASMLKNIYAIASGIAHSLGYGDNFQSVLMSNAIREMKRFIKDVYKMKRNINNSAYLGDLLVTGYSVFSRNRNFGSMIGKGYTVKAAQMEMRMVAEGYYATQSAKMINQNYSTRVPIIDAVFSILYLEKKPERVFKKLVKQLD